MRSLRRILAVRFSLTMLSGVATVALGSMVSLHFIAGRLVHHSLISALEMERGVLSAGLAVARHGNGDDLDEFVAEINRFVAVRDSTGKVVAGNTPFSEFLPLRSEMFQAALAGEESWATDEWDAGTIRSVYAPAPEGSHVGFAVVQISASLEPFHLVRAYLIYFILLAVLGSAVATGIGVRWLTKSATKPFDEITEQAAAIHAETAGLRLSVHAKVVESHGLVEVLNSMLDRLDRALEGQRRLIADVAHEIRTPITAIQGELEVALRSGREPEFYKKVLNSVLEEVQYLASINESLLLLARLEAGDLKPQARPMDLEFVVTSAVHRVRSQNPARSFELDIEEGREFGMTGDENLVHAVVDRLLDNTVKHTPTETKVLVGLC
ncbi:MAG: hypothetical protein OEZ54_12060, partial [Gemmatimonadota bacterium]|nr:hypothetical protein [Gemmatimonadota bacterium]